MKRCMVIDCDSLAANKIDVYDCMVHVCDEHLEILRRGGEFTVSLNELRSIPQRDADDD